MGPVPFYRRRVREAVSKHHGVEGCRDVAVEIAEIIGEDVVVGAAASFECSFSHVPVGVSGIIVVGDTDVVEDFWVEVGGAETRIGGHDYA